MRVHLGVEADFRPARKAHPALVVADLRSFVERTGVDITWAHDIPDVVRGHIADPFGNRIELVDGGHPVVRPTSGRAPFHGPSGRARSRYRDRRAQMRGTAGRA